MGKYFLLGEELITEESRDNYVLVSTTVEKAARKTIVSLKEKIESYTQLSTLAANIKRDMDDAFGETIEMVMPLLYDRDVYDLDVNSIVGTYLSTPDCYGKIQSAAREVKDTYQSIIDAGEEEKAQREYNKQTRGRFEGGGFGLEGALKGAAQAAVLNAGTGLLHSIGNAVGNAGTDRKVNRALNDVMHNSGIQNYCVDAFGEAALGITDGFIKALENFADMEFEVISESDSLRADNIMSAVKKGNVPKEKEKAQLLKVWELNPFNEELYLYLLDEYGDPEKEIERLAGCFNVNIAGIKEERFAEWFNRRLEAANKFPDTEQLEKNILQMKKDAKEELAGLGITKNISSYRIIKSLMQSLDDVLEQLDEQLRTVDGKVYTTRESAKNAKEDIALFESIVNGRDLSDEDMLREIRQILSETEFQEEEFASTIEKRLEETRTVRDESRLEEKISAFEYKYKRFDGKMALNKAFAFPDWEEVMPDPYEQNYPFCAADEKVYLSFGGSCTIFITDKYLHYTDCDYNAVAVELKEISDITYLEEDEEFEIVLRNGQTYHVEEPSHAELVCRELLNAVRCIQEYQKNRPECLAHEVLDSSLQINKDELDEILHKCDTMLSAALLEQKNKPFDEDDDEYDEEDDEDEVDEVDEYDDDASVKERLSLEAYIKTYVWKTGENKDAVEYIKKAAKIRNWDIGQIVVWLDLREECDWNLNGLLLTDKYIIGIGPGKYDYEESFVRWRWSEVASFKVENFDESFDEEEDEPETEPDDCISISLDDGKLCFMVGEGILSCIKGAFTYLFEKLLEKATTKREEVLFLQEKLKKTAVEKFGDLEQCSVTEMQEYIRTLYCEEDMLVVRPAVAALRTLIQEKKEACLRAETEELVTNYAEKTEEELEILIHTLKQHPARHLVQEKQKEIEEFYEAKKEARLKAEAEELVKDYAEKTEDELKILITTLKAFSAENLVSEKLAEIEKYYKEVVNARRDKEAQEYCESVDTEDIWSVAEVRDALKKGYADSSYAQAKIKEYDDMVYNYITSEAKQYDTKSFEELTELRNKVNSRLKNDPKRNKYCELIKENMQKKGLYEVERQSGKKIEDLDFFELHEVIQNEKALSLPKDVSKFVKETLLDKLHEQGKEKAASICRNWDAFCRAKGYNMAGFYMGYKAPTFAVSDEQELKLDGCSGNFDNNEYPVMMHGTGFLGDIATGFSKGFLVSTKYLYTAKGTERIHVDDVVRFEVVSKFLSTKLFVVTRNGQIELQAKLSGGQDKYIVDMLTSLIEYVRTAGIQNPPILKAPKGLNKESLDRNWAMLANVGLTAEEAIKMSPKQVLDCLKEAPKSSTVVSKPISSIDLAIKKVRELGIDKMEGVTIAENGEDLLDEYLELDHVLACGSNLKGEKGWLHIENAPYDILFLTEGFCCTEIIFSSLHKTCPRYGTLAALTISGPKSGNSGSMYNRIIETKPGTGTECTIESDLSVDELEKIVELLEYLQRLAL